jgi:hypothetical protein
MIAPAVVATFADPARRRRLIHHSAAPAFACERIHRDAAIIKATFRRLPVETVESSYSIGIVTLRKRTVSPFAQGFIDSAREIAKPLTKRGLQ